MADQVTLLVWSDYLCPWCYNAAVRLRRIEQEFQGRVALEWRSFLLRPYPDPKRTLEQFRTYTQSWTKPAADDDGGTFRVGYRRGTAVAQPAAARRKAAARLDATRSMPWRLLRAYFAGDDITKAETLLSRFGATSASRRGIHACGRRRHSASGDRRAQRRPPPRGERRATVVMDGIDCRWSAPCRTRPPLGARACEVRLMSTSVDARGPLVGDLDASALRFYAKYARMGGSSTARRRLVTGRVSDAHGPSSSGARPVAAPKTLGRFGASSVLVPIGLGVDAGPRMVSRGPPRRPRRWLPRLGVQVPRSAGLPGGVHGRRTR
jgi:hypothetical protein